MHKLTPRDISHVNQSKASHISHAADPDVLDAGLVMIEWILRWMEWKKEEDTKLQKRRRRESQFCCVKISLAVSLRPILVQRKYCYTVAIIKYWQPICPQPKYWSSTAPIHVF
jgi:hypothetical protein